MTFYLRSFGNVIFNVARLSGTKEYYISEQYERNVVREQWAKVKHKTDQAYRVTIFFIHDQIKQDKVLIEHCPTLKMRADLFTKPLQGMLFYRLRDLIMNIAPESPYHSSHRSVLQDMGEGRNKSNDNPASSAGEAKTSSGVCTQTHTTGTSIDGTNDIIQDGVSNTQNQHRLINSN